MSSRNEQNFILDKIRELLSKGYTQRQIATQMQISLGKCNGLIQELRAEAKQRINNYVNEELPGAYQATLDGVNQIIKITWESVDTTHNNRDKFVGLQLLMQAYEVRLHLLSSAETLKEAVEFVDQNDQNNVSTTAEVTEAEVTEAAEDKNNEDKTTG